MGAHAALNYIHGYDQLDDASDCRYCVGDYLRYWRDRISPIPVTRQSRAKR